MLPIHMEFNTCISYCLESQLTVWLFVTMIIEEMQSASVFFPGNPNGRLLVSIKSRGRCERFFCYRETIDHGTLPVEFIAYGIEVLKDYTYFYYEIIVCEVFVTMFIALEP